MKLNKYDLIHSTNHRGYVLLNKAPFIKPMLDRLIDLVHQATDEYGTVFVQRFDLQSPATDFYISPSDFTSRVSDTINTYRKGTSVPNKYVWVLEQSSEKNLHAHVVMMWPKNKVQTFRTNDHSHGQHIAELWSDANPESANGHKLVNVGNDEYQANKYGSHVIRRSDVSSIDPVITHLSYMAKLDTKPLTFPNGSYEALGCRRWGSSSVKRKAANDDSYDSLIADLGW